MPKFEPFREKMSRGEICLGTTITFTDPAISESLAGDLDFIWIDAEHNALSLETIQLHLMAVRGTSTFPRGPRRLERSGAAETRARYRCPGRVIPLIRTAEDAQIGGRQRAAIRRREFAVSARGGRARYGRDSGPEYCRNANDSIMVNVQIEHAEAVKNHGRHPGHRGRFGHCDRARTIWPARWDTRGGRAIRKSGGRLIR